jgi:signal transduction histidine kinase
MRGGLGRTLLTAFLILTILPLALIGGYAAQHNRRNLQQEVKSKLQAVATLRGVALRQWFEGVRDVLLFSLVYQKGADSITWDTWWGAVSQQVPDLTGVIILGKNGRQLRTFGDCWASIDTTSASNPQAAWVSPSIEGSANTSTPVQFSLYPNAGVSLSFNYDQCKYIFCLHERAIDQIIQPNPLSEAGLVGETGQVYLITRSHIWPGGKSETLADVDILQHEFPPDGLYINHHGVPVIGAYHHLSGLDVAVLVEQSQAETLASTDRIAATLIALVLAVALATTAIAAVVIRQITRPVIQLTESAVAMAEGDLDQYLSVKSRDEIGILTYVFNEMASELKSLYEDLEAKVAERTKRLQQANYQIQRRALHLQASQEVGQAITSMRDPTLLLSQVADLIRDRFAYASVAIYISEPGGGVARRLAFSPKAHNVMILDVANLEPWGETYHTGDGTVVERAIRKCAPQVVSQQTSDEVEWYRRTLSRVAVPLRMGEKVLGAIAVLSTEREGVQGDELEVLEMLANQVAIALENARAYERERLATQRLEEAEAFKARFLANMSHELREPLNTIIGFSRLMIKGIDGTLSDQQLQDLQRIYDDGQRLLFLINDILAISQIQAGLMELKFQPVSLKSIVSGVMPTASALVRGKDIELSQDVPDGLPLLWADPGRLRQVMVHLLSNAAKFTEEGEIAIRAWCNDGDLVYVSVRDTGLGIPEEDRERIFARFETGEDVGAQHGIGLGLALSKEFVEMHGGKIWVESEVGEGSTFTFSLPCYTPNGDLRAS